MGESRTQKSEEEEGRRARRVKKKKKKKRKRSRSRFRIEKKIIATGMPNCKAKAPSQMPQIPPGVNFDVQHNKNAPGFFFWGKKKKIGMRRK